MFSKFIRALITIGITFGLMHGPIRWSQAIAQSEQGIPQLGQNGPQAIVIAASRFDISPPLRDIKPDTESAAKRDFSPPHLTLPKNLEGNVSEPSSQPGLSSPLSLDEMPEPLVSFDGIENIFGGWPPDTQGDIGANHYVQWINLHFAIWQIDRGTNSANLVHGPVPGNNLFDDFGGYCETTNNGDPITLYDPLANRWFMSQFALPNYPNAPFYQCVAVSTSDDPTGSWYRYEFLMPGNKMNDYPKFGVWHDAYYMTVNQFNSGTLSWAGAGVAALERSAMLAGLPARMLFYDLYSVNSNYGGMLPADFDGSQPPPGSAPGYFVEWDDASTFPSEDALRVWEFHVDWVTPGNSTFGLAFNPNQTIATQDVDPGLCIGSACIPQPGTNNRLDAISDRLMYRLQYRNFSGYETLVTNHTVDENNADHAGIHWVELRRSGGLWSLHQEGVFAPDADHRWMGSIAMDHNGNLALGYSVSSQSTYPSVRYTGRLAGDPLGTMPQGERSLVEGSGSQTGASRWGDYSMMALDPVDDCTFWYTQEYVEISGSNTWKTRIGSFRFPNCSLGPQGELQGSITESGSGTPLPQAKISVASSGNTTLSTYSRLDGTYSMRLLEDTYDISVSAYGYYPQYVSGVSIISDTVTTQDFALDLAPYYTVSGVVSDANTGWPLYARIEVEGAPFDPIWTDPVTGFYSLQLPAGSKFSHRTQAVIPGYLTATSELAPLTGDTILDISLEVDGLECNAPGYQIQSTPVFVRDFESDNGGLSVSGSSSWEWGIPTSGPYTAHSGSSVWATQLDGNYNNNENGYLNLPAIDLSAYAGQNPVLNWWQWLRTEDGFDYARIEVSKDGGSTWDVVYGPLSGRVDDQDWTEHSLILDSSYAVSDLLVRFHFTSDYYLTYHGWYVDDLSVNIGVCQPTVGGLVVGNVYDGNTLDGINGASLVAESGGFTISQPTQIDPAVDDGFYTLFSPAGTQMITATRWGGYQPLQESIEVIANATIRQDFYLPAGSLVYNPSVLDVVLKFGKTLTVPLTLTNQGGVPAAYEWLELIGGEIPLGPFEEPLFATKPFKSNLSSSESLKIPPAPAAAPLAGGNVIQSWSVGDVLAPWGIAYDGFYENVWVSSPDDSWGGDDTLYEFSVTGLPSGRTLPHTIPHSYGPADMAYNWNTGKLWIMNVATGEANCIYEIDRDLGYSGNYICPGGEPGFSVSQRGLAYDPYTDTWFAGGWNDLMVHRFDSAGNILSSVNVGLAIAGLAYNPVTQHLFAITNSSQTFVYVLDAADNFNTIGSFIVSQGFGSYSGAGLEIDCSGNLWAIDHNQAVVAQFESGESTELCAVDVPWLQETPVSGTVASFDQQVIEIEFNAGVPEVTQPGIYLAQIMVKHDTPYVQASLPVTMTILPLEYGVSLSSDMALHDIPGQMVTYTLTVTNTGDLPADTFDISLGTHDWDTNLDQSMVGPLASGEAGTFQVFVEIPSYALGGEMDTVQVTATSQGDNSKTASATLTTTADLPLADLEISKTAWPVAVLPGELLTYTLVITNNGPTKAGRVTLVDVLPDGVLYVSDDSGCILAGSTLACDLGSMQVGDARTVHIVVTAVAAGWWTNVAVVFETSDPDTTNNWATWQTQVFYPLYLPLIVRTD